MASPQLTQMTSELQSLSSTFLRQREIKGHWEGGEFNGEVDGFNGSKHNTMEQLLDLLGKKGTPFELVLEAMGQPDEIGPENGLPLMPGPVIIGGKSYEDPTSVLAKYYWRGRHDYVWFKVDQTEKVSESGWYSALE